MLSFVASLLLNISFNGAFHSTWIFFSDPISLVTDLVFLFVYLIIANVQKRKKKVKESVNGWLPRKVTAKTFQNFWLK